MCIFQNKWKEFGLIPQVIDTDQSKRISFQELCIGIKQLVKRLPTSVNTRCLCQSHVFELHSQISFFLLHTCWCAGRLLSMISSVCLFFGSRSWRHHLIAHRNGVLDHYTSAVPAMAWSTFKMLWNVLHLQDFRPRIHLTQSDFASFTAGGRLCGADGQLGASEFETAMRKQVPACACSNSYLSVGFHLHAHEEMKA